ncbi:putative B3 domain-containing protein At2g27410 [Punica granatum]|uniref:B3 domain-containing protein At2g27410 n=1 Tax=Punica granatum TaxID=22663 RepID=A0A218VX20_PUNGR|nr:putative B3 domain-containing protein At2g27410 [Punica granatum]OWM64610.1 hypothetical protein CDL15_Pgr020577 [Punica granatum]
MAEEENRGRKEKERKISSSSTSARTTDEKVEEDDLLCSEDMRGHWWEGMTKFDMLVLVGHVAYKKYNIKKKMERTMALSEIESSQGHELSRDPATVRNRPQEERGPKHPRPPRKPKQEGPLLFHPKDMPQDLRGWIERELGGSDIGPVCQKVLTETDVTKHYSRLSLPKKHITSLAFLNDEELATLQSNPAIEGNQSGMPVQANGPSRHSGIPVQAIGPSRHRHTLSLRKWESKKGCGKKSNVYVLTTRVWTDFVEDNNLHEGDEVQIWSFRVGEELYMAIVVVERASEPEEAGDD